MARKSSLGPFPKTHRWRDIVQRCLALPVDDCEKVADELLTEIRPMLEALIDDPAALKAVSFFAALPIVSRYSAPENALGELFAIRWSGDLRETLLAHVSEEGLIRLAAIETFDRFTGTARFKQSQIGDDPWLPWRELDGSAFCELGRLFFACLTYQYLFAALGESAEREAVWQHAWETSRITQSFSARWFNKCAVGQVPESGNIRWYLGHCLGKVDMELEREVSTHEEPLGNPFRRRKLPPPSLGLGL